MKISKLFHWLYAVVMLLPVFAIGITCCYAMFNKNAYQSYSDTENTTESIANITDLNEYVPNLTYYLELKNNTSTYTTQSYAIYYNEFINKPTQWNISSSGYFTLGGKVGSGARYRIIFYDNDNNLVNEYNINDYIGTYTFILNKIENINYFNTNSLYGNNLQFVTYIVTTEKLDNVFYYSVDRVTQSNLFNWAYDSFLVAPFSFIVGLFSMPTNSPVVMLLSYWLAISIIWLVFDLVMYVPLLVHRWLDKGAIE